MSADTSPSHVTPAQILEGMKRRITELEEQLAQAKTSTGDQPRLQDLSPDELALVAVGAAGEIIKAARAQAQEVRDTAEKDADRMRLAAREVLSKAHEEAEAGRAETARARDQILADARTAAAEIMERIRSEAASIAEQAKADAESVRSQARSERDRLIGESQVRLQSALRNAEHTEQTAASEGRKIIDTARTMADSLRIDAQQDARSALAAAAAQLKGHEEAISELTQRASGLRGAVNSALEAIRSTTEVAAAEAASAEASSRSLEADLHQMRMNLQRRLDESEA